MIIVVSKVLVTFSIMFFIVFRHQYDLEPNLKFGHVLSDHTEHLDGSCQKLSGGSYKVK